MRKGNSVAHQNSILSQDPNFYSSYEYEEQEESGSQNIFIKLLLQLILILGVLFIIYFAFNYISNTHIDFKKFNFWNSEKPIQKIKRDTAPTESRIIEANSKNIRQKDIVEKNMEDIHKEKLLDKPKTTTIPTIKPTKKVSHKQEKKPYLVDEYLEAIKKELGKN